MQILTLAVNGSGEAWAPIPEEEYRSRLDRKAEEWRGHRRAGLKLRHETGVLLNDRFGPPTAQQNRGEGVLEEAAGRLQVAVSDLSRMRRFAHHFKSFEDFEASHPEAKTWSAVKELLPKLRQEQQVTSGVAEPAEAKQAKQAKRAKPASLERVKRSLADLASVIRSVPPGVSDDEREEVLEKLQELVRAVHDCLQIQITVGQMPAEETPLAATETYAPEQSDEDASVVEAQAG